LVQVESLTVIAEVARLGSITGAAESLRYTQSAVSRQVAALEAELGVRLFDRLPRGVVPTEEGRCLLRHADAILDRLAAARAELRALGNLNAGRLRVGAFASADAALVPRALAALRASYPAIQISLVEGVTPGLLDRLAAGDADVCVVSAYPYDPLDARRFDLHPLLDEAVLVAVPRAHRLARRRTLRLADLADESWVAGSADPEATLLGGSVRHGFRPRIDFVAGEWTAKLGFVAAGLGVTLVPALAARAAPGDIALVALHRDEAPVRRIYAATLAGRTRPVAVDRLLTALATAAADLKKPPPRRR
jgi:DNA-binding transcriptional LysR family regulator